MSSSDYYWSRQITKGFGTMWFLMIPQEANSTGGGDAKEVEQRVSVLLEAERLKKVTLPSAFRMNESF